MTNTTRRPLGQRLTDTAPPVQAVTERIPIGRGRTISIVGRVDGERVNVDVATDADIMCSELTRDEAEHLRDALDVFLGDRKAGQR